MKYQDYATPSDTTLNIMKQNYDSLIESETQDLQEILEKMKRQRTSIADQNIDGRYDDILIKLDENILELENLINSNHTQINSKRSHSTIPSFLGLKKAKKLDNSNAISPIRSIEENNSILTPSNNNNTNQTPSDVTPNTPSNQAPSDIAPDTQSDQLFSQIKTKRNSPTKRYTLSYAIEQFNQKLSSLFVYKKSTRTRVQNRFHNTPPVECEPRSAIFTNQIDLIRLMLIYLMLRPNCKYLSRIATIANCQLDILLGL